MINIIKNIFFKIFPQKDELNSDRTLLKDIKRGDEIFIYVNNICAEGKFYFDGIGVAICLNNDYELKRMLIQLTYTIDKQKKIKKMVFSYDDKVFNDFNLLNNNGIENVLEQEQQQEDDKIYEENMLNEFLDYAAQKEYFELANEINKIIEKNQSKTNSIK